MHRSPIRRGAPGLVVGLVLAALLALVGCGPDRDASPRRSVTALPDVDDPEQGAVLSEELMLALSLAKNYHHKADLLSREAAFDEAAAALRAILVIRFPEGAPEAEDVRLDARARLAKLLTARGRLDEALEVVEDGLQGEPRRSFFLANLYTVQGEVYEARARAFDEQEGREAAAAQARRAAIRAFDESIRINRGLQEALLSEDAP